MRKIKTLRLNPNEIYVETILTANEEKKYIILWKGKKNLNKLVTVTGLKVCGIKLPYNPELEEYLEEHKRYSDQNVDPKMPKDELDNILEKSGCRKIETKTLEEHLSEMSSDKIKSLLGLLEKVRSESSLHCQTGIDLLTLITCELNGISIDKIPRKQANCNASEKIRKLSLENVKILLSYDEIGQNVQYRVARRPLTNKEENMISVIGEMTKPQIVSSEKIEVLGYISNCKRKKTVVDEKSIIGYLTETESQLYEYALSQGHYQVCLDILQNLEERLNKDTKQIELTYYQVRDVKKRLKIPKYRY